MDKKIFSLPVASKCHMFLSFYFLDPVTLSTKRFKKFVPKSTSAENWEEVLNSMLEQWTMKLAHP